MLDGDAVLLFVLALLVVEVGVGRVVLGLEAFSELDFCKSECFVGGAGLLDELDKGEG